MRLSAEIQKMWADSAPLTATAALMLAAFVASVAGIILDHRVITGVPAWLKPAKFAISIAIYTATLAWMFRYLTIWPKFVSAMGWIISLTLILELVIIDLQAARGTTSHFNESTPLNTHLFHIMGVSIGILWLASVGVLIALWRQPFADPAWGWTLRLGVLATVLGSATGGLMLGPHAHTVGASDGGPGLPGIAWSANHGDLRVPHFFGLHGMQLIPLIACFLLRNRALTSSQSSHLVVISAVSYMSLVAILTWQALRGQPLIKPDAATGIAFTIWLAATALTCGLTV